MLPLVIRPRGRAGVDELAALIAAERPRLHRLQLRHGAILFRGFEIGDAAAVARLVGAAGERPMRYLGGSSQRTHVAEDVYTSTELPPDVHIPLHSELAYLDVYPRHLWFACVSPPRAGGETVLAEARRVYDAIDERVRQRLIARGVRYRCSFHGPSRFFALVDRLHREVVAVAWERGDVLWLDNLLCMHGRNPFRGPRRILAAMTR